MKSAEGEVLAGSAGSAVEIVYTREADDPPDWSASLAAWFLTCPGQSPAWEHYVLSTIHLRPIDGVRPAVIRVPGATHEVLLYACDPRSDPTADPATWRPLHPINVMEQVTLPDDASAAALLRDTALAVVVGLLWAEPPLSGQVEPWRTSLIRTSAHFRGEEHAP